MHTAVMVLFVLNAVTLIGIMVYVGLALLGTLLVASGTLTTVSGRASSGSRTCARSTGPRGTPSRPGPWTSRGR